MKTEKNTFLKLSKSCVVQPCATVEDVFLPKEDILKKKQPHSSLTSSISDSGLQPVHKASQLPGSSKIQVNRTFPKLYRDEKVDPPRP